MAILHSDVAGLLRRHGYTEIRKVGEGSFGKAVLVEDTGGNRLICKMVDVSKASNREMQDAVKEGKLLAELRHPYIVRYRESFTDCGWLCILMDYCEGGDLTKQIEQARRQRRSLDEEQILRWFTQGVLALKYIHEKHILHRDLKPSNFFLSKHGNMKMGDFGIAKVLECTIAAAKTQIGTPYYLSPELCQEKPYTWPSDIWAMGCILFELCALKVPFDAPNIPGLVQKIIRAPLPALPSGYSKFLTDLCKEMLNRNPDHRPSPDDILARPRIKEIVQKMMDEMAASETAQSGASAYDHPVPAPLPQRMPEGPYAGTAGAFKKDDLVEYWSSSHNDWLPATVVKADADGRIVIDLKPNTWLSKEDQATKVRPRARKVLDRPSSRGASPSVQRSPSAGGLAGPPVAVPGPPLWQAGVPSARGVPASPLIRRSPSVGAAVGPGSRPGSRGGSPGGGFEPAPSIFRRGDLVEYWSVSHKEWLPATITNVDAEGRIVIDLKPNTWLSKEDQALKVRPRAGSRGGTPGTPGSRPGSVASPNVRRSPSVGAVIPGAPYGRAPSPRRDPLLRAPSPRLRRPSEMAGEGTPRAKMPLPPGIPRVDASPLRQGGRNIAGL